MTLPQWDEVEKLSDAAYNNLDILVTARVAEKMRDEGGLKPSLFDQSLLGPSLTCSLRGMRVDHAKIPEARAKIENEAKELQTQLKAYVSEKLPRDLETRQELADRVKFGKGWKLSSKVLQDVLYVGFKVRVRLSKEDNPSVAKDILADIRDDPKTPEAAIPVVEIALQLSELEADRQALDKPAGPDGRIHSSFMVSSAVSGRWGSRKDSFNEGMNLHSASDFIREIFIPDAGCILVSMDQVSAESNMVAHLAGSEFFIEAHRHGSPHVSTGKVLFPEKADVFTKSWAKATEYPGRPGKNYYDMAKSMSHGLNYGQSAGGLSRQLKITKKIAEALSVNYFSRIPEIQAYHRYIEAELRSKRKLVSPTGRVRQFLGRVWDQTTIREAISWQPQGGVSDITKIFLWRCWKHLDPTHLQILMEQHDSILFQVEEKRLAEVMEMVMPLSRIPIPIGPRVLENRWEVKVGDSWANMKDWP